MSACCKALVYSLEYSKKKTSKQTNKLTISVREGKESVGGNVRQECPWGMSGGLSPGKKSRR